MNRHMHRGEAFTRVSDSLGERLQARLASQVGHRPDLYLGDYRMAGSEMATIAVGFNAADFGQPSLDQVNEFIIRASLGNLRPHPVTAKVFPGEQAVLINVTQQRAFRTMADMQSEVAPLGGNRYIQAGTENVWELEDVEGVPTLYRVAEENLENLLSTMRGQLVRASAVRVARCIEGGTHMAPIGALIGYFDREGQYRSATVMAEADSEGFVHVRQDNDATRIHVNQIREVLRTAELEGATKTKLERYFAEMFGDKEYAKDLVREASVQTGTEEQFVGFLTTSGMYDINAALLEVNKLKGQPGHVGRLGPTNAPNTVYAQYNGNGFEWEIDADAMAEALNKQNG